MSWWICWISRGSRILRSMVPMISSTFQRLPWKTCGLFDSGFAGDVAYITSSGLNASVSAVDEYDPLSLSLNDLGPDGQPGQSLYPSTSGMKAETTTEKQQQQSVINTKTSSDDHLQDEDSWFGDLDPDLSGDPLGDDSMEAFINLDKFLNGNSFFDEDGNLTVPEETPITQEVSGEAEVEPVISLLPRVSVKSESVVDPSINDYFMGPDTQDFLLLSEEESTTTTKVSAQHNKHKPSRKRKAVAAALTLSRATGGVKTSLYEIPATSLIPELIQEEGSTTTLSDTELDHDYSSKKRQRLDVPDGNESTPSTSGAMRNFIQTDVPQTVIIASAASASVTPVQLLDETVDKQTIRRIKNNHASKRSREQRKQKFVDMDQEAEELVVRNQQLREKIVELEMLAKEMKAVLVAKMAGRAV